MNLKYILTLLLVLVLTISTSAQHSRRSQANFRTLEGTVIDVTGVSRWSGIIIESGGRKYVVQLYNSDYPKSGPKVIGGNVMGVGTRVKVVYINTQPWVNNMLALNATRVIKLDGQTGPKNTQQASPQSSNWDTFWNAFSAAVRNKNRAAIRSMASSRFDLPNIDNTVSGWIRNLDRNNLWYLVQNSVNKGTTSCDPIEGKPCRCTRDLHLYFVFENGRWHFSGVGGV